MTDEIERDAGDATSPPADSDSTVPLDTVFRVLSNRHRRFALYSLSDAADGTLSLEELFEDVTTLVTSIDADPFTRGRYGQIASDLYHWHLPVLADTGLVDCDPRTGTIRYRPQEPLERWLDRVRTDELG